MNMIPVRPRAEESAAFKGQGPLTCAQTPCSAETLACLPASARASGDLAAFDWAAQTSRSRLATCLTRIHNALADPTRSVAWFKGAGFFAYADTRPPGHFREGKTTVHASWQGDDESFPAPRVLPLLTRLIHDPVFSMAVHMDRNNVVESVQFGKSIK